MRINTLILKTVLSVHSVSTLAFFAFLLGKQVTAQIKYEPPPSQVRQAGGERMNTPGLLAMTPDPVKYPARRTKWDGKPDFSGVFWDSAYVTPSYNTTGVEGYNRPRALDVLASLYLPKERAARATLDPVDVRGMHCWPESPAHGDMHPRIDIQLVSAPGFFAMINGGMGNYRIIPTNGGPHDRSAKPTFQGDSVGHWEGDALVVDVTNFVSAPILGAFFNDRWSDALHVVERWTMPDSRFFEYENRVEDPKILTAPWTGPRIRRGRMLRSNAEEALCVQDGDFELVNSQQHYRDANK